MQQNRSIGLIFELIMHKIIGINIIHHLSSAPTRKYFLVKWASICRDKVFERWGVINLEHMNYVLLAKWGWKYFNNDNTGLWKKLVTSTFFAFSLVKCSSFWKDVMSLSHFISMGTIRIVGDGSTINFWLDSWHNNLPLALQFSLIFAKSKSDRITLAQVLNTWSVKLNLTRGVSRDMRQEK
jgi:hypothetical protein